jgi:GTP-binding protein EngB required for normal cell division
VVVATKADKLKASERTAALRRLEDGLAGPVTAYSSMTGEGRERLWSALKARCRT